MKKATIIFLTFIWGATFSDGYAQNLIPNGSFETHASCPAIGGEINYAPPWTDPSNNSSDYFHPCCTTMNFSVPYNAAGYQAAYNGVAYAGIAAYYFDESSDTTYREYIQVPLNSTLSMDSCYQLRFYVSIGEQGKYGVNSLSGFFSPTSISCSHCYFNNVPQVTSDPSMLIGDTIGWTMIEGIFKSQGNESYLTIGNFKTHSNTVHTVTSSSMNEVAYYFIDSVSLVKVTCPIDIGINENTNPIFHLYPNPANEKLNIQLDNFENTTVIIYNMLGENILKTKLNSKSAALDISTLDNGVYIISVDNGRGTTRQKIIKNAH